MDGIYPFPCLSTAQFLIRNSGVVKTRPRQHTARAILMSSETPLRMVQLTPGAGKMFCGACLRDNALVTALRHQGHSVVMAPMYLPLTLDEDDQTAGTPIFFSGINVFLDQQSALFRKSPGWLHRLLASPSLLRLAAGAAGKTRAEELGPLTISMLRGEEGLQARELDDLIAWLRLEKPEVVCLSNALLVGMARRIRAEVRAPVICSLQGEDYFLDGLPEPHRAAAWRVAAERAADVDLFIAPSRYYAQFMADRLKIAPERMKVLVNGIKLDGYEVTAPPGGKASPPVLGYFARMCREKGLDQLIGAFLRLKKRDGLSKLKLRVGGSCGPTDQVIVDQLRGTLADHNFLGDAEFCPNLSRADKLDFLRSLTVFSVPARHPEAFGLYVIEALASGVPVVQPDHGGFSELVAATRGGRLFPAGHEEALADAIEALLRTPEQAQAMGEAGRAAVRERFTAEAMAGEFARLCRETARKFPS
jgi:glycosyltransferase involved in cell wall biosynthesis